MNEENELESPWGADPKGSDPAPEPSAEKLPLESWDHLAWCPGCGARLERRQCKARCFRCGYFQDCSDTIV